MGNKVIEQVNTIYENNYIRITEIDGAVYIKQINPSVIILPYIQDDSGMPLSIGVISEISKSKPTGISKTLITGSPNDDDDNILRTAIRELREESGFNVESVDRWKFLGNVYTSKIISNPNPCFSVDVTGLESDNKITDGSQDEIDSSFEMMSVSEALSLEDSLVSTLFIKHFKNIINK